MSSVVDFVAIAKEVLEQESNGILAAAKFLDESFNRSVKIIGETSGKVILTGMGKPGHIANKIAATMSSTGTPAIFVHPAEASHGDLGMLCKEDCVIMFSLSGETAELINMISFTRRFGIKLVSVTANQNSTLAKSSDAVILIPKLPEACPNGLAPTTSTTIMLAIGDALAVSLIKHIEFGKEDFKVFHPSGALGKKLLTTSDLMAKGEMMPLVKTGVLMSDALIKMSQKSFGCLGVIDEQNKLLGIITDGDLRRHMSDNIVNYCVDNVMTKNPITISPSTLVIEAVGIMNSKKITSLFVTDQANQPVGLLHIHTLLGAGVV